MSRICNDRCEMHRMTSGGRNASTQSCETADKNVCPTGGKAGARRTRRSGFVTTLAVMMIALVAVALAALTTLVGTAARQATAAREQAQVELLIQAGAQIAARQTGDFRQDVALPDELKE